MSTFLLTRASPNGRRIGENPPAAEPSSCPSRCTSSSRSLCRCCSGLSNSSAICNGSTSIGTAVNLGLAGWSLEFFWVAPSIGFGWTGSNRNRKFSACAWQNCATFHSVVCPVKARQKLSGWGSIILLAFYLRHHSFHGPGKVLAHFPILLIPADLNWRSIRLVCRFNKAPRSLEPRRSCSPLTRPSS